MEEKRSLQEGDAFLREGELLYGFKQDPDKEIKESAGSHPEQG